MPDPKNETIVAPPNAPGEEMTSSLSSRGFGRALKLPQSVWTRLGLLLLTLGLVKCVVVYALRRELFQTHWRIAEAAPTWVNGVAFCLFAILLGANLWRFGRRLAANHGVAANWMALAGLSGISVAFLLLTFHQGKWNYLYAGMNEILTWSQVGDDFKLRFFFGVPYLGAWMLGFGIVCYALGRTGRERYLLRAFALLVPAYLVIYLRELAAYQVELLALDALGIACLVAGGRSPAAIKWPLALAPYILMTGGFILFQSFDGRIARPAPEFLVPMAGGVLVFVGVSLLAWRRGFYAEWSWLLPFASAAFLVLMTASYPLADNYRNLLVFGLALPRYFAGSAVVVTAVFCVAMIYFRLKPTGSWLWLDILGLGLVALAIVDLRLTQIMEVRLDWQLLSFADSPKMMWRMAKPYLPMVAMAFTALTVAYFALLKVLHGFRLGRARPMREMLVNRKYVLSVLLLLGLVGVNFVAPDKGEGEVAVAFIKTSPWWKRLSEPRYSNEEFIKTANELGMGSMLEESPSTHEQPPADLNVVLIFQESAYNKHLSLFGCTNETQPLLSQYKDRMELFPNFHSSFAGSVYARFATLTGIYPTREFRDFTSEHVACRSIFEVLGERGYDCSVFDSCSVDYCSFRDLLRNHGVKRIYDADSMPGERKTEPVAWGLKEDETMGAILGELETRVHRQQRFFLSYFPVAPHQPFDGVPKQFQKFPRDKFGDFTPGYMNELLYLDWVIASILDKLKDTGLLDKTLVIITSDHGEMLGHNGGPIGHGWILTPELTNIPLIVMDPRRPGYHVNPVNGSQVDLLPTILDILGIPIPHDELYQGTSLHHRAAGKPRTIYLNSFRQFALVRDGRIICGDREIKDHTATSSYRIVNRGSQTEFIPTAISDESVNIERFDQFQGNFLRHYQDYVQALRSGSAKK